MRPSPSTTFPLFRSQAQARALTALFLDQRPMTAAALARAAGVTQAAVGKWLPGLVQAGIVAADRSGAQVLYSTNTEAPFHAALRALLEITCGPPVVIAEEFAGVAGVERMAIFGSWAARASDLAGDMPHDIDLLVVGSPEPSAVADACRSAAARLRRPINPVLVAVTEWESGGTPLLDVIRSSPLIPVAHEGTTDGDDRPVQEPPGDRESVGDWESDLLRGLV